MLLVLMLGGLFYRSRKKKDTEDEYVKATSDSNKIYEKFYNPFNRKNDKDDDFDKVLWEALSENEQILIIVCEITYLH